MIDLPKSTPSYNSHADLTLPPIFYGLLVVILFVLTYFAFTSKGSSPSINRDYVPSPNVSASLQVATVRTNPPSDPTICKASPSDKDWSITTMGDKPALPGKLIIRFREAIPLNEARKVFAYYGSDFTITDMQDRVQVYSMRVRKGDKLTYRRYLTSRGINDRNILDGSVGDEPLIFVYYARQGDESIIESMLKTYPDALSVDSKFISIPATVWATVPVGHEDEWKKRLYEDCRVIAVLQPTEDQTFNPFIDF